MKYHVVVIAYQGIPAGVELYNDIEKAELAYTRIVKELEITPESDYAIQLFYNTPLK